MELRDYQRRAVEDVRRYLQELAKLKQAGEKVEALRSADLGELAWRQAGVKRLWHPRQDGLGRPIPAFCLKIPTGGGKTLLAVKVVDAAQSIFLKRRTGLVLWVVPTTQIYSQTLKSLRDRQHPYRQHLDMASGGRTVIVERHERFAPTDVDENLVVLMLMLPAANRVSKEQLRMFRDSGGFEAFFPADDDRAGHAALLKKISNLDTFKADAYWGGQVKTSLGNTLRLLRPIIVLDEGQKAYSLGAQMTLNGFNPSLIIELSATPPAGSSVLVDIPGADLEKEDMIKLDLHVVRKASQDWRDTLSAAVERRAELERLARKHEAAAGVYIRPICLIQAERVGKDQREKGFVHAEDVKDRLLQTHGIPAEQIAIKTSEKDELKEVDDIGGLMSRDCQIRFIITKQALQEGWDCPFAYVLAVLTNPKSEMAMTQLVGRILRQPHARKTRVAALDESYVFCHRPNASDILNEIRRGFQGEGLGDLASRVVVDSGAGERTGEAARVLKVRGKIAKAARSIILPVFAVKRDGQWRPVSYETDIEALIPWDKIDVSSLCDLALTAARGRDEEIKIGLGGREEKIAAEAGVGGATALDPAFIARQMLDIVPNPWAAHAFGAKVVDCLAKKHGLEKVASNQAFIVEQLRLHLVEKKDELARKLFLARLKDGSMRFILIGDSGRLPERMEIPPGSVTLNRSDGTPTQKSLFEFMPAESFNTEERKVAWYLEGQERLFFWYRNRVGRDYSVQGWRHDRFWPDFIFATTENGKAVEEVHVIETKGEQLSGNLDTNYKKALFDLCNRETKRLKPADWPSSSAKVPLHFEVLSQSEWEQRFNELFGA